MESDESSSEDRTTSSDSSTDSSDDEKLETVHLCGSRFQLPQGLCERTDIFYEFFSAQTWNSLSEVNKQHLRDFLPTFPENDEQEKNVTLQKLFDGDTFRFTNPLQDFHNHLKAGHYRPDIAKMRYLIRKAERKEAKFRYKKYREKLEEEVLESRQALLNSINNLPPGVEPRIEKLSANTPSFISPIAYHTKRRYFMELASIRSKLDETGFSSDENYPEGPSNALSRKQKRHLNSIKNSHFFNGDKIFISTLATKPNGVDLERNVTPSCNPFYLTEDSYKSLLSKHKRLKLEKGNEMEFNTKDITITDVIHRTKLNYVKKLNSVPVNSIKHHIENKESKLINRKKLKRENYHLNSRSPEHHRNQSSNSEFESDSDSLDTVISSRSKGKSRIKPVVKNSSSKVLANKINVNDVKSNYFENNATQAEKTQNPEGNTLVKMGNFTNYGKITPATLSDLDGIDMMNLPIDLDDSNIDILDLNTKPELMQETHANFLSLIRDIICSTNEHRMNMNTLEERLKSWQENPISPLNDWYSIMDNWCSLLQSAVNFLSGNFPEQPEDFVPYIEYKPQLEMYQWIGAGRDSDGLLSPLCQFWLDHKGDEIKNTSPAKEKEDVEVEIVDRTQTPPPPRCPTTWSVRKADLEEIKAFQEQERRRYNNPHKAFTYRCNGYESVVGPLKGIYNPSVGNAKARGHTMLTADRPNFVTILSLVRDATARLPNGEGTRADICELLKSSQYISSTAPDNVLQSVVSGALDRMHTQFDPCVKYDAKRKIWIYLHRNRSEEDFERIHQQYQGMNKNVKKNTFKGKSLSKPKRVDKNKVVLKNSAEVTNEKHKNSLRNKTNQIHSAGPNSQSASPNSEVARASTSKSNSLLLPHLKVEGNQEVNLPSPQLKKLPSKQQKQTLLLQEDKEIQDALQAIQNSNNSVVKPLQTSKGGKSLVKIITANQGKSIIIPGTASPTFKQTDQKITTQLTSQLFQTIANQKQVNVEQVNEKSGDKQVKVPVPIQQQFIQTISQQQLQNMKNVTLLRNITARQSPVQGIIGGTSQAQTITLTAGGDVEGQSIVQTSTLATTNVQEQLVQVNSSLKVQQPQLTNSQQHQLFQTLKQKVVPVQTIGNQQQIILKQKTVQKQVQPAPGTSLLGQSRIGSDGLVNKPIISGQTPLVAKVLTNAAGQVISVESLLAHQKQHGSLPQGTTLRVKSGPTNIIQLTSSKAPPIAQLSVGNQNNYITLANQPKLVLSSQPTTTVTATVTVSKPSSKTIAKSQGVTKVTPKMAQQLINAKFITQNVDTSKIVQPKVIIGQNQVKLSSATNKTLSASKSVTLSVPSNTNTIRMVNTANLNLTHIDGKPVLLASKGGGTLQNIQGQNVILQTQANSNGNAGNLVAISSAKTLPSSSQILSQHNATTAQVVLGSPLKVQQPQQIVLSSNVKSGGSQSGQGQIVVGGHPVRLQAAPGGNTAQRVVLASQGQGGQIVTQQILLPSNFQGTAINIKALQGVKVIPIAQAQQTKGVPGRQVFARVMAPSTNIIRASQTPTTPDVATETNTTTE